jgi:hypothetical protein
VDYTAIQNFLKLKNRCVSFLDNIRLQQRPTREHWSHRTIPAGFIYPNDQHTHMSRHDLRDLPQGTPAIHTNPDIPGEIGAKGKGPNSTPSTPTQRAPPLGAGRTLDSGRAHPWNISLIRQPYIFIVFD